jgi:hypothetical protein
MTALQQTETLAPGRNGGSLRWWSPLPHGEAIEALQALGASPVTERGTARWVLAVGEDVFSPVLCFEPTASDRGSECRVFASDHGFSRDFRYTVQAGLTGFAALVLLYVASSFSGGNAWVAAVGVALCYSVFMGLFAAARVLMAVLGGHRAAVAAACRRARQALFACNA